MDNYGELYDICDQCAIKNLRVPIQCPGIPFPVSSWLPRHCRQLKVNTVKSQGLLPSINSAPLDVSGFKMKAFALQIVRCALYKH